MYKIIPHKPTMRVLLTSFCLLLLFELLNTSLQVCVKKAKNKISFLIAYTYEKILVIKYNVAEKESMVTIFTDNTIQSKKEFSSTTFSSNARKSFIKMKMIAKCSMIILYHINLFCSNTH